MSGHASGAAALLSRLRAKRPLIHCIAGAVSLRDSANALLALGARPIMARLPGEVHEILGRADALLINLGTPESGAVDAMLIALDKAAAAGIPVVFDAVGAGLSRLRTELCAKVLELKPQVVKGNASELRFLIEGESHASGVDSAAADAFTEDGLKRAMEFARTQDTAVFITGESDYVINAEAALKITGGHALMGRVTATGCMAGALCAGFASVGGGYTAAVSTALAMAYAGEAAAKLARGPGSFIAQFHDELYALTPLDLEMMEERIYELGL